jgi:hypothetical protein
VSDIVSALIERASDGDFEDRRQAVAEAAALGLAYKLPAGARDNDTARVLIDGVEVGQMSVLGHRVTECGPDGYPKSGVYGLRRLYPVA